MKQLGKTLFIIYLLLISTNLYSVDIIRHISNKDGLSNNAVNCIFEDSENNIWFGTWDGLNCYNGRDLKSFRYGKNDLYSISNNIIRQICEQKDDYLWIATDYGVNKWNKKTQQFHKYFVGTEQKVPRQEKAFIIDVSSGNCVYCFVVGEGLFYYDESTDNFHSVTIDFTDYVDFFFFDDNNHIFFKFKNGDVGYCPMKSCTSEISLSSMQMLSSEPAESVFYSEGCIFLYSGSECCMYSPDLKQAHDIKLPVDKKVSDIVKSGDKLYISFYQGGCAVYNLADSILSFINGISEHTPVFSLYHGNQEILWIGTDGQGVMQVYKYAYPFNKYGIDNPVRTFLELDHNQVLVGTKGSGIKMYDVTTDKTCDFLSVNDGLINNSIYCMARNGDHDVFIGTEGAGINILSWQDDKKILHRLTIPSHYPAFRSVYDIHFTNGDSVMWLGTSGYGLIKICIEKQKEGNYKVREFQQYTSLNKTNKLTNDVIYSITTDDKNNIWFGTRGGGLNRLNILTNTIERLEDISGGLQLTNNDILSLAYADGNLWVGTSYGLNKLEIHENTFHLVCYTDNEGLNNNTIHGVLPETNGSVWVSTNRGISVIDRTGSVKNFNLSDGLQNNEFSDGAYYIDKNNYYYFGGVSGFNRFKPVEMVFRDFKAPMELSSLKIFNNSFNVHERIEDNKLKLSYDERYVTLSFISKDFINNENCEYAYRLRPYSDEWIFLGNNPTIVFSQLPSGKYTLEVKSTNGDKIWNESIYRLELEIGYPWWLTTPAFVLYVFVFALMVFVTHSVIKKRIRLSRQLFIEQVERQQLQKEHESRLNFFTNIAHEFFTPLTLIYGPAQHLLERKELEPYIKRYLQIIKNNADRMQKLISELMEFRKVKVGHTPIHSEDIDIKVLVEYVSDNYVEVLRENKIEYSVDIHDVSNLISDRNYLEKIFFNLISNAYKYTPRNGFIHIEVWQDVGTDHTLHFTICNSGSGLTRQQMEEVFDKFKIFDSHGVENTMSTGIGLNLTKSLTELLGGAIKVDSVLGEYTEFSLFIPPMQMNEEQAFAQSEIRVSASSMEDTLAIGMELTVAATILVVEDERSIREFLRDILSVHYKVEEAYDGKSAMQIIEKNYPDIIVSDILMPNMDGITLFDILKSNPKTANIPIVSISARNSAEDQIEVLKHGADVYITKPFHPKQVLVTVENLLLKRKQLKEYFNSEYSSVSVRDGIEIHKEDEVFINAINDYVSQNISDESLSPNSIADFLNVSKASLYRKLKELTDKTPSEFVRKVRLAHAARLLITTRSTISEIMYMVGFSNRSYFNREFQKEYGSSPKDYRNKHICP